jgi:hypothetical protein
MAVFGDQLINWLTSFKEAIVAYSDNHINTLLRVTHSYRFVKQVAHIVTTEVNEPAQWLQLRSACQVRSTSGLIESSQLQYGFSCLCANSPPF